MSEGPEGTRPPGGSRFVYIVDEAPPVAGAEGEGPVLLVALEGFLDAGNASRIAVNRIVEDGQGPVVASFEIDAFYDYRARRPPMSFIEDHYANYEAPRLVVRRGEDDHGTPYLLLHGPEPDTHWEAFIDSVRHVVEHFGVRLVMTLGSVPMAVPHTRPVMTTQHATRPELLTARNIWSGEIRIPSSAATLLELRLGVWGLDALGFVAHVPHYLGNVDYPAAAVKLLQDTQSAAGLYWDLDGLVDAAAQRDAEIADQIEESDEVRNVVAGLEQQYDSFQRASEEGGLPLAEERELPTAEELGAEFERFLAGLDDE